MSKLTRLSAEQRANLVAYLDGELDDTASQELEHILSRSEVARHEVDMLSHTWDMLDLLPRHKASQDFKQKTVAGMRAMQSPRQPLIKPTWVKSTRRGMVWITWVAGLVAVSYLGFVATNQWYPNPAEQLVDDLPIIVEFDKYSEVGQIEFLRELKKRGLVGSSEKEPHARAE